MRENFNRILARSADNGRVFASLHTSMRFEVQIFPSRYIETYRTSTESKVTFSSSVTRIVLSNDYISGQRVAK